MSGMDFGRQSEDYALHRRGFPESFYRRLETILDVDGRRVLDLATGPGTIALELAARGASVVGIDVSEGQIETARRLAKERGLDEKTTFRVASAEDTGMEPESFDLATAGSCWHWFDADAVLRELQRVLRPGAALVIAHDCYLARHSDIARDSEELVLRFNPTWSMAGEPGIFPDEIDEVIRGGFELVEAFCYDHDEAFSHERWRGRMRACNGVGPSGLPREDVARFDESLRERLAQKYPDPVTVPHRVWCVVARKSL